MPNPILVGTQLLDSQAVEVDPGVRYPGGATQNRAVDRGRGDRGGPCVGGDFCGGHGGFHSHGGTQNGGFIYKGTPGKIDDLGVPPIYGNLQMFWGIS